MRKMKTMGMYLLTCFSLMGYSLAVEAQKKASSVEIPTAQKMQTFVDLYNKNRSPQGLLLIMGSSLSAEDFKFIKSQWSKFSDWDAPEMTFGSQQLTLKSKSPKNKDIVLKIEDLATQTYSYKGAKVKLASYKSLQDKFERLKALFVTQDSHVWLEVLLPRAQADLKDSVSSWQEQASSAAALAAHYSVATSAKALDGFLDLSLSESERPTTPMSRIPLVAECMQKHGPLSDSFRALSPCILKDKIEEMADRFPKVGKTEFKSHLTCERPGQGIVRSSRLTLVRPVGINANSGSKSGYICYDFKFNNNDSGISRYIFKKWSALDGTMQMAMFDAYDCDAGMIRDNTYNLKDGLFINQKESSGEKPKQYPWKIDDFMPILQLAMKCCISDPSDQCPETFNALKTIFTDPKGNPIEVNGQR